MYFDYKTLKLKLKKFKKKKKKLKNKGVMKVRLLECAMTSVKRSVTKHDWKQQPVQSRTLGHCYETKITQQELDELHDFIGHIESDTTTQEPQEQMIQEVDESQVDLQEFLTPVEEDLNKWVEDYKASIDKVNDFFLETFYKLKDRLDNTILGFQLHCLSDDENPGSQGDSCNLSRNLSESSFNGRPKSNRKHHRHGAQKDRLQYATSWTRAFYDIYEEITWLQSYCRINRIATTKILKKFTKVFFDRQINKLVSYLYEKTDQQCFVASLEPVLLKNSIIEFYRAYFTNGDKMKAKKELERNPVVNLRKKDVIPIAFFSGLSLGFFILLLVIIFTPLQGSKFTIQDTYASLPAYRFTLMFILVALSAGILIQVYRRY